MPVTDTRNASLVKDRIYSDRGLARLAVADDELSLATPNRYHGITLGYGSPSPVLNSS